MSPPQAWGCTDSLEQSPITIEPFSPQAWGCTDNNLRESPTGWRGSSIVFPTGVGVYRFAEMGDSHFGPVFPTGVGVYRFC